MILFDQGSIDGKCEVKVEKCHLIDELKLKILNLQKVACYLGLIGFMAEYKQLQSLKSCNKNCYPEVSKGEYDYLWEQSI